jgi:histidine transport system substrate-binding protein
MTHTLKNLGLTAALAVMLAACTPAPKKDTAPAADASKAEATVPVTAPMKIRFGTDASYAPFESKDPSGTIVGFDIDLGKAICAEIKAECTFQDQAWDGIIPGLEAKKYDAILSSMSITEERKAKVDFTQKIWNVPNAILGKEGTTLEASEAGLKDKTIGVQKGTIQETFAKATYKSSKIKSYGTIEEAYTDLVAKRSDVVFADAVVISDGFMKSPKAKGFAVLAEIPASVDPKILGEGTGIAVRKGDKELLDALNRGFEAIRTNGKYKEIADKYFKFEIYS